MKEKLDALEVSSLNMSVEVRNVPKIQNEEKQHLFGYITNLAHAVNNLDLTQKDIRDVARMPSKKESSSSSITIEFTNTLKKLNFLKAVKRYNQSKEQAEQVNSSYMGIELIHFNQPIYISELLTAKMKRLLCLTYDFAKTFHYKSVWSSNGQIYLRKGKRTPCIRVKNEVHLN